MSLKTVFESPTTASGTNGSLDIKRLKRRAKILQKKLSCTLSEAQDAVAKKNGFVNWSRLMLEQRRTANILPLGAALDTPACAVHVLSAKRFFSDCLDDISLVQKFISAGGNLNEVDEDDETELIRQSRSGHPKMVAELLRCGANASYSTKNLHSALREAAGNGQTQACRILIDHGIDVDEPSYVGNTPLNSAAHGGHYKTCEMLLSKDASMVTHDDRRGRRHSVLCTAAMRGRIALFPLFVANGIDINFMDAVGGVGGWNALMWAVYHGNKAGVRSLIDLGADVNLVCEKTGETALMHAAQDGKAEIFDLLLASGARAYLRNLKGESALDKAGPITPSRSSGFDIPWRKDGPRDNGRIQIRKAFDPLGFPHTFYGSKNAQESSSLG
jgi:ankyrin repeat protein